MTGLNPVGPPAAMPRSRSPQSDAGFVNLIKLVFDSTDIPVKSQAAVGAGTSARTIADGLIRSMLMAPVTVGSMVTTAASGAPSDSQISSVASPNAAAGVRVASNGSSQTPIPDETSEFPVLSENLPAAAGLPPVISPAGQNQSASGPIATKNAAAAPATIPRAATITHPLEQGVAVQKVAAASVNTGRQPTTLDPQTVVTAAAANNANALPILNGPPAALAPVRIETTPAGDLSRETASTSLPSTATVDSSTATAPAVLAPLAFSARLTEIIPETAPDQTFAASPVASEATIATALPSYVSELPPGAAADSNPIKSFFKKADAEPQSSRSAVAPAKLNDGDNRESRATTVTAAAPIAAIADFEAHNPAAQIGGMANSAAPNAAPETSDTAASAPPVNVSETLRAAEPSAPETPAPASPLQQIAVRIPNAGGAPVDLHIAERGGEIQVSVRTADATMQASLRQDLGTLTSSLEKAGYRAEMFTSHDTAMQTASPGSTNLRDDRQQPGSSGRGGSGNPSNGRQQQQPQREQRHKTWIEEMEKSK